MKTIQFLTDSINKMQSLSLSATITIGSFTVSSFPNSKNHYKERIAFRLRFRPDHIQHLIDIGVKIDFNSAVMADLSPSALRFKKGREAINQHRYAPYYRFGNPANQQTGVIENWLVADATCGVYCLSLLDKYVRDNHEGEIAIHNDHCLNNAGWKVINHTHHSIGSQLFKAKEIRKNVNDKRKTDAQLLPIERMAMNK